MIPLLKFNLHSINNIVMLPNNLFNLYTFLNIHQLHKYYLTKHILVYVCNQINLPNLHMNINHFSSQFRMYLHLLAKRRSTIYIISLNLLLTSSIISLLFEIIFITSYPIINLRYYTIDKFCQLSYPHNLINVHIYKQQNCIQIIQFQRLHT